MSRSASRQYTSFTLLSFVICASLIFFLIQPERAVSQTSTRIIFHTSGTTWTVPSDWNNSNNSIEVIGAGGGGRSSPNQDAGSGGGGGGGAYARVNNVPLAPGATVSYGIGSGGSANSAGGDTYFCSSTSNCGSIADSAVIVGAKGGSAGQQKSGGAGGSGASSIGTITYSGGAGGTIATWGGAGGGGGAGPSGSGGAGGAVTSNGNQGGGGGGGGGGSAGGAANGNTGGVGGSGPLGSGGGVPNGGNGSNGGGGAGGFGGGNNGPGGHGSTAAVWTQTSNGVSAGPGGGGGGAGDGNYDQPKPGGNGGLYGGGGGGTGSDSGTGGSGAQGIIVISYSHTSPTAPTITSTPGSSGITLTWPTPADGGSPITGYKIYRDTSSPASTLLTSIPPAVTYLDSSALVNTTYYYTVKATNAVGDSAFSNEVSATRPCTQTTPISSNVRGWAWSDTIGWISLSSADSGTCTNQAYGLTIASDGTISGKMWSENVGWISADAADLSGCPTSPCTARMNGNQMQGWMKALAANQAEAAWDGWISLSGSSPTYGPTITNGTISGYAWGDTNLGWIAFSTAFSSATTTWVECSPSYQCTDETHYDNLCTTGVVENTACTGGLICGGGAIACVIPPAPTPDGTAGNLKASPQLIAPGRTTTLTWDIRYATSCTVTEDNANISDSWNTVEGNVTTSIIRQQTVYTLQCTGAGGTLTQNATVYQTPTWKEI